MHIIFVFKLIVKVLAIDLAGKNKWVMSFWSSIINYKLLKQQIFEWLFVNFTTSKNSYMY